MIDDIADSTGGVPLFAAISSRVSPENHSLIT
jgi:hypothetical protein